MNILITSAGRRVSLVRNFQKYAKVFTCDLNPYLSAACQISDGFFKAPSVLDENYIPFLLKICKDNKVDIIVPTIDTELSKLAEAKGAFKKNNILIAVSNKEICDTFYLKTTTYQFFKKTGFNTPKIIDTENLKNSNYPLFAKINNSSSSTGAQIVNSYKEALVLLEKNKNYIFQELVKGIEYTVDVFIDRFSNVICIVPRQRIEVRAGEVSKGKTVKDKGIIKEVFKLSKKLKGAYGCITIQLFKDKNGKIWFIEINPRFGGGYPLTWLSGADYAKFLIDDYLGKNLNYFEEWKDNLIMLRYDAEVLIDGNSL